MRTSRGVVTESNGVMEHKQAIAFEIALQTHVLQTCPVHNEVFYDDDVDPSSAFALAVELVRQHKPYVDEFHDDAHALTDLLSETIGCSAELLARIARVPQGQSRGGAAGAFD